MSLKIVDQPNACNTCLSREFLRIHHPRQVRCCYPSKQYGAGDSKTGILDTASLLLKKNAYDLLKAAVIAAEVDVFAEEPQTAVRFEEQRNAAMGTANVAYQDHSAIF